MLTWFEIALAAQRRMKVVSGDPAWALSAMFEVEKPTYDHPTLTTLGVLVIRVPGAWVALGLIERDLKLTTDQLDERTLKAATYQLARHAGKVLRG